MWDPYECVAHPPDIPNLITDATKILEVDRELIGPCLDELVAAEGVVRELVTR